MKTTSLKKETLEKILNFGDTEIESQGFLFYDRLLEFGVIDQLQADKINNTVAITKKIDGLQVTFHMIDSPESNDSLGRYKIESIAIGQ